jgi:hypothetical protein
MGDYTNTTQDRIDSFDEIFTKQLTLAANYVVL